MLICKAFLLLAIVHICFASDFIPINFNNCEVTKGCMKPPICLGESCSFLASWMKVVVNGEMYVEFELLGDVKGPGGFISLAFSEDTNVGNDGVVGCYHDQTSSGVVVKAGYNEPNSEDYTTFYHASDDPDFIISTGENLGGLFNALNNVLQCRFRRRATPRTMASQLKDLENMNSYYLVLSRGTGIGLQGFNKPFPGGQLVSRQRVVITSPVYGSLSGTAGSPVAKAHGCLMVLAWVFCASVGILVARYYKDMWPNSGLLHERVWLQSHQILQIICVILNCIGIILAFSYCQGYSVVSAYPNYVHPILGLIVFILTLINPFLALCRCHPKSANRPWFNWIHFIVGTLAYVLAVPTMMLGLRMPGAGMQLSSIAYPLWILIFFIIFQFCIEIILELHGCIYYRRNKDKRRNFELDLDQYHAAMRLNSPVQPRPAEPEPSGRMFKYFIIGLHSTVCAIIAIVLVIIIAVN